MVKTDLTEEEKKLIIEALNNKMEFCRRRFVKQSC